MTQQNKETTLCCPLCGSEEYLLSEKNSMLCAECGSFFEDLEQVVAFEPHINLVMAERKTVIPLHACH
ncbi:hypothetical protein [Vibrio hepatarius]|jgi:uncharacterized Zn finger protein|uniref:Uncharacterized protein n=1 Tax=Vibrio hepatarius TaxID=171383 RepID=A0A0M0I4W7_9VIBR|nr:hypothetical protein [Vibrio hepatarius]KOO09354.1 hypothetical protein AKJ31_03085 [Vibrio hepatarius]